jgi:hypothetical protein
VKHKPIEQNLHVRQEFAQLSGVSPKQLILMRTPISKCAPSLVLLFRDHGLLDEIAKDVARTRVPQIRNSAQRPQL